MAEKPKQISAEHTVLVAPGGKRYQTKDRVEIVNLRARGYKVEKAGVKPAAKATKAATPAEQPADKAKSNK